MTGLGRDQHGPGSRSRSSSIAPDCRRSNSYRCFLRPLATRQLCPGRTLSTYCLRPPTVRADHLGGLACPDAVLVGAALPVPHVSPSPVAGVIGVIVPATAPILAGILRVVVGQVLAARLGDLRGHEIGTFRHDFAETKFPNRVSSTVQNLIGHAHVGPGANRQAAQYFDRAGRSNGERSVGQLA